jgi:peptide/nickel transport system substrate-binding protein
MTRLLRQLRLAGAALVLLALASAAPVSQVSAAELRVGLGSTVTAIDPLFYVIGSNSALARNIFDALINQDDQQHLTPALATAWRAIDDTTWEFTLRQGVTFHDGTPFTAEDVAASIRRIPNIRNSPSSFLPFVRPIKRVTVVDPHTIRFETDGPFPLLPSNLSRISIHPARFENASLEDFNSGRAAIGTGPFKFVSFTPGDRIVVERNSSYWGGAPAWDRVTFRIVTTDAARVAGLIAGDFDVIENVPTADVARLRRQSQVQIATATSNRVMYLHLDTAREQSPFVMTAEGTAGPNVLRDLHVRQAISRAIDRAALVDRIMDGQGVPAAQLVPEGYFGYAPSLTVLPFDRNAPRALLAEAGLPHGFRLTLHASNDRYPNDERQAQAIAQMLTRAGIPTQVVVQPASIFFTRASALEYSMILAGAAAETGEAASVLRPLLETFDPAKGAGTGNRGRYSNAEFDATLDRALATVDDAARERLLSRATEIGIGDLGVIPLFFLVNSWATRPGFAYAARSDGYTLAVNVTAR